MSATVSWHPKDGVYRAEIGQRDGATWVTLQDGREGWSQLTLFFDSREHAERVADALNRAPSVAEAEQPTPEPSDVDLVLGAHP